MYNKWVYVNEKIRFHVIKYYNWDNFLHNTYEFEVYKKPYFFGSFGKKRWMLVKVTDNYLYGLSYSELISKSFFEILFKK